MMNVERVRHGKLHMQHKMRVFIHKPVLLHGATRIHAKQFVVLRLTEVTEATIQSWVTETSSIGPVAAAIIGTVALLVALLPI